MIEPKELRIGSLVQIQTNHESYKGFNGDVRKVSTIFIDRFGDYVLGIRTLEHDAHSEWDATELSPIPLTEEWLKAMGYQSPLGWVWNNKTVPGLVKIEDGDMWWCFGNDIVTEVPYVHSLQNIAFALTGQELTYTP